MAADLRLSKILSQLSESDAKQLSGNGSRFVLRYLELDDYAKGFPEVLSQLTQVGTVTKEMFIAQFNAMKASGGTYHVLVIEDTSKGKIIAAATLILELKFIRECSRVGHVEDVVVDKTYRGHNLGFRIVDALNKLAQELGCYKIILDCEDKNITFYEKLGYKEHTKHMALYFDKDKKPAAGSGSGADQPSS